MKTNEISSHNGDFYRTEGASGFSTFVMPVVSIVCLMCFCTIFPIIFQHGWSALDEDALLVFGLWTGIAFFTLGITYIVTKFQHRKSYLQIDKEGISGRTYLPSYDKAEFAYKWDEIMSVSFRMTRIIITSKNSEQVFECPFLVKRNLDLLLALNKYGGERVLDQNKLKRLQNHRYKMLIITGVIAFIYAIGMSAFLRAQPYYYSVYDATIVDGNTYAVGNMSEKITISELIPVMWKNNEIVILGSVGCNYACRVAVMNGVPYVYCELEGERVILKNKDVVCTLPSDEELSIDAMTAYEDSLFIMGQYGAQVDSVIKIWKYVDGAEFISISNEEVSDAVWEKLQSEKKIYKVEMVDRKRKKSHGKFGYRTRVVSQHNYFSIKKIGNDWYELMGGKADVRCEEGEIMSEPLIIKYTKKNHPNDWTM